MGRTALGVADTDIWPDIEADDAALFHSCPLRIFRVPFLPASGEFSIRHVVLAGRVRLDISVERRLSSGINVVTLAMAGRPCGRLRSLPS
jgi:hypothetical protein